MAIEPALHVHLNHVVQQHLVPGDHQGPDLGLLQQCPTDAQTRIGAEAILELAD